MTEHDKASWLDEEAGRLVRPYAVSNGRTAPTHELDLLSLVMATGKSATAQLDREHAQALSLCQVSTPVAEVAARLGLPLMITKVLLSDLIDSGAVTARPPGPGAEPENRDLLKVMLNGLRKL